MTTLNQMLTASAWARALTAAELARVESETLTRDFPAGCLVVRKGDPAAHWVGIVDGLVKMVNVSAEGRPMTFTGIGTGGWFGEGSVLKDEPRRYDIVALRRSVAALMPKATFMRLLDSSIAFNRFVITQLNERLGQFIGMMEYDRLLSPDARLARCIAGLYNPVLYPGIGPTLPISQEEIAQLAGLSRQRVNQALHKLEEVGLLRIERVGITVRDLAGLRSFED